MVKAKASEVELDKVFRAVAKIGGECDVLERRTEATPEAEANKRDWQKLIDAIPELYGRIAALPKTSEVDFLFVRVRSLEAIMSPHTDHTKEISPTILNDLAGIEVDLKRLEVPVAGAETPEAKQRALEEIIKRFLFYLDTVPENITYFDAEAKNPDGTLKDKYRHYAEALREILATQKDQLETLKDALADYFEATVREIDLPVSRFGRSDSWKYWDLAKQKYLSEHPDESDTSRYLLADPFEFETNPTSRTVLQQIADRHIGWEAYREYNVQGSIEDFHLDSGHQTYARIRALITETEKPTGFLASDKLAELGRLIRENKGVADLEITPAAADPAEAERERVQRIWENTDRLLADTHAELQRLIGVPSKEMEARGLLNQLEAFINGDYADANKTVGPDAALLDAIRPVIDAVPLLRDRPLNPRVDPADVSATPEPSRLAGSRAERDAKYRAHEAAKKKLESMEGIFKKVIRFGERKKAYEAAKADVERTKREYEEAKQAFEEGSKAVLGREATGTEADYLRDFNISAAELAELEGWDELTEGQRLLVLENLRQIMLGMIQEEGISGHRQNMDKKDETVARWYKIYQGEWWKDREKNIKNVPKNVKNAWKSLFKQYYVGKFRSQSAEQVLAGGMAAHGELLKELTRHAQESGLGVEVGADGALEIQYMDADEALDPAERRSIEAFNDAATAWSRTPHAWSERFATKEERAKFAAAREAYGEAKRNVIATMNRVSGNEKQANLEFLEIERKIEMNRLMNTNPDVEAELQKVTSSKVWKWDAAKQIAGSRGGFMAYGFMTRTIPAWCVGYAAAPLVAAAAPVTAMFAGGYIGRKRAIEGLREDTTLSKSKRSGSEALKFADAGAHIEKINTLIEKINEAPDAESESTEERTVKNLSTKKESKRTVKVKKHSKKYYRGILDLAIQYTKDSLSQGFVTFGEGKDKLSNQYELLKKIGEAEAQVKLGDKKIEAKVQARLNEVLGVPKGKVGTKERKIKDHVRKQMLKGALTATGFFWAGRLIGEALSDDQSSYALVKNRFFGRSSEASAATPAPSPDKPTEGGFIDTIKNDHVMSGADKDNDSFSQSAHDGAAKYAKELGIKKNESAYNKAMMEILRNYKERTGREAPSLVHENDKLHIYRDVNGKLQADLVESSGEKSGYLSGRPSVAGGSPAETPAPSEVQPTTAQYLAEHGSIPIHHAGGALGGQIVPDISGVADVRVGTDGISAVVDGVRYDGLVYGPGNNTLVPGEKFGHYVFGGGPRGGGSTFVSEKVFPHVEKPTTAAPAAGAVEAKAGGGGSASASSIVERPASEAPLGRSGAEPAARNSAEPALEAAAAAKEASGVIHSDHVTAHFEKSGATISDIKIDTSDVKFAPTVGKFFAEKDYSKFIGWIRGRGVNSDVVNAAILRLGELKDVQVKLLASGNPNTPELAFLNQKIHDEMVALAEKLHEEPSKFFDERLLRDFKVKDDEAQIVAVVATESSSSSGAVRIAPIELPSDGNLNPVQTAIIRRMGEYLEAQMTGVNKFLAEYPDNAVASRVARAEMERLQEKLADLRVRVKDLTQDNFTAFSKKDFRGIHPKESDWSKVGHFGHVVKGVKERLSNEYFGNPSVKLGRVAEQSSATPPIEPASSDTPEPGSRPRLVYSDESGSKETSDGETSTIPPR